MNNKYYHFTFKKEKYKILANSKKAEFVKSAIDSYYSLLLWKSWFVFIHFLSGIILFFLFLGRVNAIDGWALILMPFYIFVVSPFHTIIGFMWMAGLIGMAVNGSIINNKEKEIKKLISK